MSNDFLRSLLNFIQPNQFRDLNSFLKRFGDLKNQTDVEALQAEIAPYILRRVKEGWLLKKARMEN